MPRAARSAPRAGLIAAMFGNRSQPASSPAAANPAAASPVTLSPVTVGDAPGRDAGQSVDRRLYEEIGEFLFTHRLAPTPAHFELAHAYLTGGNGTAARAIAAMIASTGTLDPVRVAALAQRRDDGPVALAGLADRLQAQLSACLNVADRSHVSARDYGDALDVAQARLQSDPDATLAHIAELTRDVVLATRLVETELTQTRRVTDQLRDDLNQARDAAERDHLTGLVNRRGLERRIDALIADPARSTEATIALCDIDDFKAVNDVHGHQAGDRVLKYVGDFLSTALGETACVARYGGEEFAVLMADATPDETLMLLDDVRERLAARSLVNQTTGVPIGRVTFSAGIAGLGDDGTRALGVADAALYTAKRGGKNAVMLAPSPGT